jgi:hypothetical protein
MKFALTRSLFQDISPQKVSKKSKNSVRSYDAAQNRFGHSRYIQSLGVKNYMVVKSLHQFFYYHSKYLNSMKCREISMGPSKCTIQCTL